MADGGFKNVVAPKGGSISESRAGMETRTLVRVDAVSSEHAIEAMATWLNSSIDEIFAFQLPKASMPDFDTFIQRARNIIRNKEYGSSENATDKPEKQSETEGGPEQQMQEAPGTAQGVVDWNTYTSRVVLNIEGWR